MIPADSEKLDEKTPRFQVEARLPFSKTQKT
jgi:hypothetical protein